MAKLFFLDFVDGTLMSKWNEKEHTAYLFPEEFLEFMWNTNCGLVGIKLFILWIAVGCRLAAKQRMNSWWIPFQRTRQICAKDSTSKLPVAVQWWHKCTCAAVALQAGFVGFITFWPAKKRGCQSALTTRTQKRANCTINSQYMLTPTDTFVLTWVSLINKKCATSS